MDIAASAARGSFPPEDRRGFVYRACFFLGAGILFPWNSYITAVDYFERVHPGNSTCSRTELGDERAFTCLRGKVTSPGPDERARFHGVVVNHGVVVHRIDPRHVLRDPPRAHHSTRGERLVLVSDAREG